MAHAPHTSGDPGMSPLRRKHFHCGSPEGNGADALGLGDAPTTEVVPHAHRQRFAHSVEELQGRDPDAAQVILLRQGIRVKKRMGPVTMAAHGPNLKRVGMSPQEGQSGGAQPCTILRTVDMSSKSVSIALCVAMSTGPRDAAMKEMICSCHSSSATDAHAPPA